MKHLEKIIASALILGVIASFRAADSRASGSDGLLHVYFLDVGQGDAVLVQGPDGAQVLIDGGSGSRVLEELTAAMPFADRTLDAVVATHTDADHIAGLVEVLHAYDVAHIVETGMGCATLVCSAWEQAAGSEGASRSFVFAGYRLELGDVAFEVLNPAQSVLGTVLKKPNNGGIVLRLSYGNQSVLFTADIEKSVEDDLGHVDSDFLKVAHHGSKTSTTGQFLDAVTPLAAFVQVGARNTYGHPHPTVLERLAQLSIPVYRTDRDNMIELVLDGTNYTITSNAR